MLETLHTSLAFIVAIAVLIAVHEFGHFIVARRLGIKVEKFSIGFGPALYSWQSRDGEVEYVIAAIPLGGYVKMLGENPSEQGAEAKSSLSETDRLRAFDVQPPWKRASVAVAGPLFNFLFAVVAYMVIGWMGQSVIPPVVGTVAPSSIAEQSGLLEGDLITRLNGWEVYSWKSLEERLKQLAGKDVEVEIERDGSSHTIRFELPRPEKDVFLINVADSQLGISPAIKVVVDSVEPDSPAAKSGLLAGDVILQAANQEIRNIRQLIELVRSHAGQTVGMVVRRQETTLSLAVVPASDDAGFGRIGTRLTAMIEQEPVNYRMGPVEGFAYGFSRTWEMTVMTLQVLGKMATSTISAENLGGPIAIAQLAGQTAEMGLVAFISFLALISVNLGVLNLMPVPVLDGGHLVYLGIEKLRGRPLSPLMIERTQIIGIALIVSLMLFAFYNDLLRLFRG